MNQPGINARDKSEPQINAGERRSEEEDREEYLHKDLTQKIIGVFYGVYNELGFGFLESVYQRALLLALTDAGLDAKEPLGIPVWFRGHQVGQFEADLVVNGKVLLELKAVRALEPAHESQLLNYLRATPIEVGLLLNFGQKPQGKRLAFGNDRKRARPK